MKRYPRLVSGVAVLIVTTMTEGFPQRTQLSAAAFQREHGQGDLHRDDPCDQLPAPPGDATGIDKICAAGGSSSGIARGDFNGDGFADLAVGVPGEDTPNDVSNSGAVNVIYGSAGGLTTSTTVVPAVPTPQFLSQNAEGVPGSSEAGDAFGSALAAGDFNDDGYSDLAVGVPGEDLVDTDTGAVIVIYGSRNGLTATDPNVPAARFFDLRSATASSRLGFYRGGAQLGSSLAWGDFNGDGVGDLAVGASRADVFSKDSLSELLQFFPDSDAGIVWVLNGTRGRALDLVGNRILGGFSAVFRAGNLFGKALTSGDFNGDGFFDLAVGAPGAHESRGRVDVLFGSSPGLDDDDVQILDEDHRNNEGEAFEQVGAQFGFALAAGNFDGDNYTDLAVGAPGQDIGGVVDAGLVSIFHGYVTGLSAPLNRIRFSQNDVVSAGIEAGDQFGAALAAGDFNGDGRTDLAIGVPLENLRIGRAGVIEDVVDAGEVDAIYGSSSGLSITDRAPQVWHQASAGIADDPQEGDHFGASVTAWNFGRNEFVQLAPGVFVARTSADLAIGVPYEDLSGIGGAGAVNVIYGSFVNGGLTSSNNQFWTQGSAGVPGGAESGDHFGAAVY